MKRGIVKHLTSWKNFRTQCQEELQLREVQRNTDLMMSAYRHVVVFSLEWI